MSFYQSSLIMKHNQWSKNVGSVLGRNCVCLTWSNHKGCQVSGSRRADHDSRFTKSHRILKCSSFYSSMYRRPFRLGFSRPFFFIHSMLESHEDGRLVISRAECTFGIASYNTTEWKGRKTKGWRSEADEERQSFKKIFTYEYCYVQ